MKIYLAGPMSGIKDHNYPAFHAAAAALRARGLECINPAEVNPDMAVLGATATPEVLWRRCMVRDIPHLLTCNAIMLLPGWQNSRGARLEVLIAIALGFTIIDYATWTALSPWRLAMQLAVRTLLSAPPDKDVIPQITTEATETQRKEAA